MRQITRRRTWAGALIAAVMVAAALACPWAGLAAESGSSDRSVSSGLSIRWTSDPARPSQPAVEVAGIPGPALRSLKGSKLSDLDWQQFLSVYAGQEELGADIRTLPMVGEYEVSAGILRFKPRFPLTPGIQYRAVFRPAAFPGKKLGSAYSLIASFQVPQETKQPSTLVSQVHPTAGVLPENLLKFYVHFSAPMSRGHIYEHIHLLDEAGKAIDLPFLEIDEELWDPSMTRLTLFIDPGRIKRGVQPLEEIGPALEENKRYTLVIDSAWHDASGLPLKESFQKPFKVGPPDRDPPNPDAWTIRAPRAGTRQPLTISFGESLDHALAQRMIVLLSAGGQRLDGTASLSDHERTWTLVPSSPWSAGLHKLRVQTTIEDLAGNNIGKPFEVDLFEAVQRRFTNSAVTLAFEVR